MAWSLHKVNIAALHFWRRTNLCSSDPRDRLHLCPRKQRQKGLVLHHYFQRRLATMGYARDDVRHGWTRRGDATSYGNRCSPPL